MKVYAYARVSTPQQSLEIQIDQIKKYCDYRKLEIMQLYQDHASGKNTDRPGYTRMIEDLQSNPLGIEAIIIYKLDRIGRSLIDLINIANALKNKNIGLISISDSIDTTTKEGRLFFYMMGSLAEYERELIMERTSLGLAAAKAKGKRLGPPIKSVPKEEIDKLIALGVSKSEIARKFGVHRTTIYNKMKGAR